MARSIPRDPELAVKEPDRRCIKEGVPWSNLEGIVMLCLDEGSRGNLN